MKRIWLLILAAALLLVSCADGASHTFSVEEDGRYLDEDTDILYTALDDCYEASYAGEEIGRFTDEAHGVEQILYAIPDLDAALFLTDKNCDVYYAGSAPLDAALWEIDTLLVCVEVGVMNEVQNRFDAVNDPEVVGAVQDLWFSGEDLGNVFLLETVSERCAIKMGSAAYPNLYYAIELRMTEEGGVYLCDKAGRRTVALDAALAALLCEEG
ncbi:MAG: hypothetical protein IKM08_08270 [Clostridia bacterium]|nr:hypothetical protein [Clostridia bacterium]